MQSWSVFIRYAIRYTTNPLHDDADLAERLERLERLDIDSVIESVPKGYTDDVYKLRRDIDLVRRRLGDASRSKPSE